MFASTVGKWCCDTNNTISAMSSRKNSGKAANIFDVDILVKKLLFSKALSEELSVWKIVVW